MEVVEVEEGSDPQLEMLADAWLVAYFQTVVEAGTIVSVVMYPIEWIAEIEIASVFDSARKCNCFSIFFCLFCVYFNWIVAKDSIFAPLKTGSCTGFHQP